MGVTLTSALAIVLGNLLADLIAPPGLASCATAGETARHNASAPAETVERRSLFMR